MNRLVLVRHGETEWSLSGRHTGRTDLPLTSHGEAQALSLQPLLARMSFSKVLSSPLRRARSTAEKAGFGQSLVESPLLLEVDYGAYEGKTKQEIQATHPGWEMFTHGPLGGESLDDVRARARLLLDQLASTEGDVLVFSHGHFLRILATVYLDVPVTFGKQLLLDPASVSILSFEAETRSVRLWNLRGSED